MTPSHSQQDGHGDGILRAVGGDRDAMLELLLDCQIELGGFVATQIGHALQSHVCVDDILQETFVRAFRDVKSLRAVDRVGFLAWLKTIAINRVRDAARQQAAEKRGGKRLDTGSDVFARRAVDLMSELSDTESDTPSEFAARREAIDAIHFALAALFEDQREAIRLHCFERLTLDETARQMGRTSASVRGLIQRAKKSLKESMHKSSLWLSKKH